MCDCTHVLRYLSIYKESVLSDTDENEEAEYDETDVVDLAETENKNSSDENIEKTENMNENMIILKNWRCNLEEIHREFEEN